MVIGWFSFTGHPFVRVLITIPRLGIQNEVEFLVDTGADYTCVNHRDVVNMGLFPDVLRESEMTHATGIGGSSGISWKTRGSNFSTPTKRVPANTPSVCG